MQEKKKSFAFADMENKYLVLHQNGKIIQYNTGDNNNQLPIAISANNFIISQFLASTAIADGQQ